MIKHECQGIDENGVHCKNIDDLKEFEVFGDAELYHSLWVRVWLCMECAEEFGVV